MDLHILYTNPSTFPFKLFVKVRIRLEQQLHKQFLLC